MGSFINGINGPIKGKVGTVHGSSRFGKPYIKGPHKKRTLKITAQEKQNRTKFSKAQTWLKPLLAFVRQGFNGFTYKDASQGYLAAKSHLLSNAFEGDPADQMINPGLVKVSYGSLKLPEQIEVQIQDRYQLKFTWRNTFSAEISEFDQVMLLAYDIENKRADMKLTGQFRYMEEDFLDLNSAKGILSGENTPRVYHCYLAFISADRREQSNSIYLGEIPIS